ncbi:MAG: purine phosphorylase [Nitrosomonas sp.]|nr:purine phosphorylase [Nitrosomonas sp.]
MKRTGIVVAMQAEARCIAAQNFKLRQPVAVRDKLVVTLCGMGAEAARHAVACLIDQHDVAALISFGVAGALDANMRPGDLVVPATIVAEQTYSTDAHLRTNIMHCLPGNMKVVGGTLAVSRQVLTSEQEKLALATRTSACAVDMESGAIAAAAADKNIPFVAVRAITDPVQYSPPAALLGALHADGRVRPLPLLALLLRRQVQLAELLRLGSGMRAASATLKSAILRIEAILN